MVDPSVVNHIWKTYLLLWNGGSTCFYNFYFKYSLRCVKSDRWLLRTLERIILSMSIHRSSLRPLPKRDVLNDTNKQVHPP